MGRETIDGNTRGKQARSIRSLSANLPNSSLSKSSSELANTYLYIPEKWFTDIFLLETDLGEELRML